MSSLIGIRPRRGVTIAAALALALSAARSARGQAPPPSPPGMERAESLVRTRSYEQAADLLHDILVADPGSRRAKELLAFVLESRGDLAGERRVRGSLAADYPDDAGLQAAYGRVLERSGEAAEALAAYRRARALRPVPPDAEIDAAIDRMRGRTSTEVDAPILSLADPDATAVRVQAGAAPPLGSIGHVVLTAARADAESRQGTATATTDLLAASLVLRRPSGAALVAGPRLSSFSLQDGASGDRAVGGMIAGQGPMGPHLAGDLTATVDLPWEEAAVAMLHGGRLSAAEGHLYAHFADRRLLLQVGAQGRRLSILAPDPAAAEPADFVRPEATQSLLMGGADVVVWRRPAAARGEMLDDALIAPSALPTAIVVGYRRYEVSTRTSPGFADVIDLAPRGSVDEISTTVSLSSRGGRFGLELRGGLGRDTERDARLTRAGGSLAWAPLPTLRFAVGYDAASDLATGLTGRRHTGSFSIHVDL